METSDVLRPELFSLASHKEFTERWVQRLLYDDPSMLGLGELIPLDAERIQEKAGRLDLLFKDESGAQRYVVELMLGKLDPSHIIRTIDYWDNERRRYPRYDHYAVIIAEDLTARYLNVLNLFAGSIPLIAIQMQALKIGGDVALTFVKVLDQTSLRADDEREVHLAVVDRPYWESKATPETVGIADRGLEIINSEAEPIQRLNFTKYYIGLTDGVKSRNFVYFRPRNDYTHLYVEVSDIPEWSTRLEEAGLPPSVQDRRIQVTVKPEEWAKYESILVELLTQAVKEYQS